MNELKDFGDRILKEQLKEKKLLDTWSCLHESISKFGTKYKPKNIFFSSKKKCPVCDSILQSIVVSSEISNDTLIFYKREKVIFSCEKCSYKSAFYMRGRHIDE